MTRSLLAITYLKHSGTSLIEVLIAMLILSFGMLSLAAMVSFAVQMPKLSGYRAIAVNLATAHIDRMRANPIGFGNGGYDKPDSYDGSNTVLNMGTSDTCTYPACDPASLSTMDAAATNVAVRAQLPAGGVLMTRDNNTGVNSKTDGNLWIMWQEPDSRTPMHAATSDNCPSDISQNYASTRPRCLYVRFKL